MSTFRYLAEKHNLKTTLIYICLCSNNAFQIRVHNKDIEVDAGISWMEKKNPPCVQETVCLQGICSLGEVPSAHQVG